MLSLEAELALPGELAHGEVSAHGFARCSPTHPSLPHPAHPRHRTPGTAPRAPQVLVHWLACCVHDDDLVRVRSPLSVLNDYPPFNRTGLKWEVQRLPAVAGGEGVGVVVATARNVPHLASGALDVNEWVVALPEARLAPVGTWRTLGCCDAARLLRVPKGLMPLEQLACARSLCTAYRLLEDYGGLKPGDTLIQNGAEQPTGQAVVQLCKLLKIRTINLVADDDGFEATQATCSLDARQMLTGPGASL